MLRNLVAVCVSVLLGAAATSAAHITVYMGPIPLAQELEATFEAEHGDVLTVVSGPWCRRVRAEMEAGDIRADVLYGADPSIYLLLRDAGQLLPYSSPEAAAVKPGFRTEGPFALANGRYAVVVYNTRFVPAEEAPKGWDDLLDPKWRGRVVIGDPLLCSAAFAIVCGLVQSNGFDWDYIRALRENEVMLAATAGKVAEVVASGEAWAGICVHDAALRMINRARKRGLEPVLGIVWPEEGAIPIPRPVAIVRDEERPEEDTALAKAFLDFVLSPEGQRIAAKYGFIPVRADVPAPEGIPEEIRATALDWDWISRHDRVLRDKWRAVMAGG